MPRYVKQGALFVPHAPYLILKPWQDNEVVPQYHKVEALTGFKRRGAGGAAANIVTTFVSAGTHNDTGSKSSFSFSSVSFGSSSNSDRVVVIGWAGRDTGISRLWTSTSDIAGNAATLGVELTTNGGSGQIGHTGFMAAVVGTTNSGTVNVDFNGAVNRGIGIAVYSLENAQNVTAADSDKSDTTSSDNFVGSLTFDTGGAAFGICHNGQGTAGTTVSGTGITQDSQDWASGNGKATVGHGDYLSSQSGLTITANPASNSDTSACFVAYR